MWEKMKKDNIAEHMFDYWFNVCVSASVEEDMRNVTEAFP